MFVPHVLRRRKTETGMEYRVKPTFHIPFLPSFAGHLEHWTMGSKSFLNQLHQSYKPIRNQRFQLGKWDLVKKLPGKSLGGTSFCAEQNIS